MALQVRSDLTIVVIIILILKFKISSPVDWEKVKCSSDVKQHVPEGVVNIGRFPWLGVVQHTFYVGGQSRYAITSGMLIHPAYVIAAAEDIAKIPREALMNNTKFIAWYSDQVKFAIDVIDYILHPEYEEKVTFATLALLELYASGQTGIGDMEMVVLPVCLPVTGSGTYDDLYAASITDVGGQLHKEAMKMSFIPNVECEDYYENAQLTYEMMKPRRPFCASVERKQEACVWDAGVALITRQTWGHWMLLGFSMRGPGCGAPARFVSIHDFIPWIDDVLSKVNEEAETIKIYFRRQSPMEFVMYAADIKLPKEQGQCDRKKRGSILYKENSEILTTKSFAQGYYFISVMQVASFMCVRLDLEVLTRSKAAVWIEHHCHRDVTGLHHGAWEGPDYRKIECFAYYRTTAFVEFRFWFTFRAHFELSMYGKEEKKYRMPDPFKTETTIAWAPTDTIIHWDTFAPQNKWFWYL